MVGFLLSNNNLNLNIIGVINDDDTGKNGYNVLGPINSIASKNKGLNLKTGEFKNIQK